MNNFAESLQHNIRVYGWIRMLMMRVFLPLTPIYLTQVGHVTIPQLGLLVSIYALTTLLVNVPTGYLADRWTRKATISTGATVLAAGALTYALFPGFPGAVAATMLEAIGYAVISGAAEALIHDTLVAQGKAHEYTKTLGHAQSFGLIGNVVLVGLVPLTYAINPRLPFFIGATLSATFVYLASTLVEPPRLETVRIVDHNIIHILRLFVNRNTVLFFVALGLLSSAYRSYTSFESLVMVDLGFRPELHGILFAVASVFGAINGRIIHHFKRLTLLQYSLFDLAVGSLLIIAIGVTRNLYVTMMCFVVGMGFWRVRSILYQDHLLGRFGNHRYKATLVSAIGFFDSVHVWMPMIFALIMSYFGYYNGFIIIGSAIFTVTLPLFVIGTKRLENFRIA